MSINFTTISADSIIALASILGATATFVIAQAVEKKRDRKLSNREVYQQLELASIDLFRFEAENIELIRPIWEKDKTIPPKGTAEYIVCVNYVCQILNLFEIALRFRKDKILLPDVFTTWISWFKLLASSPGFPKVWKEIRLDYLPELREIMDQGILITNQECNSEIDENRINSEFYSKVGKILKCKIIQKWTDLREENIIGISKLNPLKDNTAKNVEKPIIELTFKWVQDLAETKRLTDLFINNSRTNYISHTEIQEGRAVNETTWAKNLSDIISEEIISSLQNELFSDTNIAAAYLDKTVIGYALIEYKDSTTGRYAILADIIVDYEHRKSNVGGRLVNWILPQLIKNNIHDLYAESNIKNESAHNFLGKMGFITISKVFKKSF